MASDARGDLVFQSRRGLWLILLGPIILGTGICIFGIAPDRPTRVAGTIVLSCGFPVVALGIALRSRVFRCYSKGVESEGRFISYDDMESMQAVVTTIHSEMGTGTNYRFLFRGKDTEGPFAVKFKSGNLGRRAKHADYLIENAGRAIASRMKAELATRGSVDWVERVRLGQASMLFEDTGRELAYSGIVELLFQDGALVIKTADGAPITIKASQENFYPGFYLLNEALGYRIEA